MNADRLIKMILNTIVRTLVNKGVKGAMNAATKGKNRGGGNPQGQDGQKQTKQAMSMMRRAGRL
jgi:hypothetical protein